MKKLLFLSLALIASIGQNFAQDYHWPLTTDLTETVAGKDGTNHGIIFDTDAERGPVAVLDGDGYANIPSFILGEDLTELTIAVWFKMDEVRPWSRLYSIGKGDQTEPKDVMMVIPVNGLDEAEATSGFYRFTLSDPDGPWVDIDLGPDNNVPVELGTWYYSTVVLKADSIIMYYDDVQVFAEGGFTRSFGTLEDTENALGKSFWPDAMFKGALSDLRVYTSALSKEEVVALYEETKGGDQGSSNISSTAVDSKSPLIYAADNQLVIKSENNSIHQMVSIYSLSGKLVANESISQISNVHLNSGFYIVNLIDDKGESFNSKVIVR